jgi:ABC-type transport system involved in multi-copper enzyme maturation permease subunit
VFVSGFTIGLVVLIADVGMPNAEEWGRILGGLGLLAIGLAPFIALATMFSTLFKSTATSYALSIVLVLLVMPILIAIMTFVVAINQGFEEVTRSPILQVLQLIDPSAILNTANYVMVGDGFFSDGGIPIEQAEVGQAVLAALIAMAIHLGVYLGISYWVVNRRDYA